MGVADVLMLVCDGLTDCPTARLPDTIITVWQQTITQICLVHLLRNSSVGRASALGRDRQRPQARLHRADRDRRTVLAKFAEV